MSKKYFLGGNTPRGFYSCYDSLINLKTAENVFIIKGGPGTGKSSVMKKVAKYAEDCGIAVEKAYCSSDPDSLDAIIIPRLKLAMVDGTRPHIVDPKYPGCCEEIINLGDFWEGDKIKENRRKIIHYTDLCGRCFEKAYKYLEAAGALYENAVRQSAEKAEIAAAENILMGIAGKEAAELSGEGEGRVRPLFAEAITPKGIISHAETLADENTYIIEWGECLTNGEIMSRVADKLTGKYYDIEVYYNPYMPGEKIDHICVPELKLTLLSSDSRGKISGENVLDFSATAKGEIIKYRRETEEITAKAVAAIAEAKKNHDELEKFYAPYMDFEKINKKTDEITARIFG